MNQAKILPLEYNSWDGDNEHVTFVEGHWGPFKKGDIFNAVSVDTVKCTVEEFDPEGEVLRSVPFAVVPADSIMAYAWIRLLCIMGFRWSTTLFREVIYRIYRYLFPPTPEPRILPAGYTFDLGGVKFGEPYIEDLAIKFPIEGTGLVKDMTIKYLDTVVHVTQFAHRLPVCFGDIVTVGPMWMPCSVSSRTKTIDVLNGDLSETSLAMGLSGNVS